MRKPTINVRKEKNQYVDFVQRKCQLKIQITLNYVITERADQSWPLREPNFRIRAVVQSQSKFSIDSYPGHSQKTRPREQ